MRRRAGIVALVGLLAGPAIGCGSSGSSAPKGWRGVARDRGEAERLAGEMKRLDAATQARLTQTLDAMAAVPRTPAGLRAAAQLAVDARLVPADWDGSGTHPAVSLMNRASVDVLAGLVAAAARDARQAGSAAQAELVAAVAELPLVRTYNSGGPISDEADRARLLAELELVLGARPAAPAQPPAGADLCRPVQPQQRAATARVQLSGDVTSAAADLPAICGAFHTARTNRFEVGDGTLFRACFPDGSTLAISADVVLAGKVTPRFVYKDYKKTGPLVELTRPGVGTYNQRDEPTEADRLDIAFDWSKVTLSIDLPWPSKLDRVVHVEATWDCGGPLRENTWAP